MEPGLVVAPTADPRHFRAADGTIVSPPSDWELLAPGDPGLTRRVKTSGPSWTVVEMRGRKKFSRGVWAPKAVIAAVRTALAEERANPAYARRRASAARHREATQSAYVEEFAVTVLEYLAFAPPHAALAQRLAAAVTAHATPVGSGTVARTKRIGVDRRAEAAVIAWLRHQTTTYDNMVIPRIKGQRRQVRQQLATRSRQLLDAHRTDRPHARETCPLCRALPPTEPATEAG